MKVVGTTGGQGFFSVGAHNGKVYAGEYSREGRVYSYPPWKKEAKLNPGESVYSLNSWKGDIYASTENNGKLFKNWQQVHASGRWGFDTVEFNGMLYSSH